MNYEERTIGQRLSEAGGMDNESYYERENLYTNDGFEIIEPISEEIARQIAEEIGTDYHYMDAGRTEKLAYIKTTFDVAAHADCKAIGDSVGEIGYRAEGRARKMRNCPLLAQARQNSLDAEKRLKMAKGKDFPEESKPEDQYRHLKLTDEQVVEALNEFLTGCEVTSSNKKFMTAETLFVNDRADSEVSLIRDAVRACVYAYITQGKRANKFFNTSSIRSFQPAFLDWFYNFQHYPQGEFHMLFSDLYQIFLEKTCMDA